MLPTSYAALVLCCAWPITAQFPPRPTGISTLFVKDTHQTSLTYKETRICETSPGVKAYAGYVHLPSSLTQEDFNISTFYWFFEARNSPQTAPLAIYLAGGPGESSLIGATGQGGPCTVNEDSNSTTLNPWSWNNHVNMLYIDQPVQTGFSYDTLVNGTLDLIQSQYTHDNFTHGIPRTNTTFLVGTFPSQDPTKTTAGSQRGASALWHFMQIWADNFPMYTSKNDKISLWGNSWGGFFTTTTFAYFERQNQLIKGHEDRKRSRSPLGRRLNLDVLGIANGCVDPMLEAAHYPEIATNNTYGFQGYDSTVLEAVTKNRTMPNGCEDQIQQCRSLARVGDPDYDGRNETVNKVCSDAFIYCINYVQGAFSAVSNRSVFDMAHQVQDPFPAWRTAGFLNQAWVQQALGVPLNFTATSPVADQVYTSVVGDAIRTNITHLEYVLQQDLKIAMVFGDRDYRCNWLGGENISLSASWQDESIFRQSGYSKIITNSTYNGGLVRQAGKLSFSRVIQSGHAVMSYQPETMYRIFQRATFDLDVATGKVSTACHESQTSGSGHRADQLYHTNGPATVREVTEKLPPMPSLDCDIWDIQVRCSEDQIAALQNGTAVLKADKVVEPAN